MKIATDLEESKRLAKILPQGSSDMYWDYDIQKHEDYLMVMDEQFDDTCTPAWSFPKLCALIQVEYKIEKTLLDQSDYFTYAFVFEDYRTCESEEIMDAAIEFIIYLKKECLL